MKLVSPKDLTKRELDYAVAVALKFDPQYNRVSHGGPWYGWTISTPERFQHLPQYHMHWKDCGPILALMWAEDIRTYVSNEGGYEIEFHVDGGPQFYAAGATPQEAILRLFVLKELGEEVSIPLEHLG